MELYDVIVIGQGYAGLRAAKLAAERGLSVLNFEKYCMGGLIMTINELDPAPADAERIGSELTANLSINNMDAGIGMPTEEVTSMDRSADDTWQVNTNVDAYKARHVIIASGAKLRKLGVVGEEEFFGQGVSECADCDGPLFRGLETVIVGGGDSAFQEAAALVTFASKVTMVIRGKSPRARQDLISRVQSNPKIVQIFETELTAIEGVSGKGVEKVQLRHLATGSETSMPTSGVFIFIGLAPNTAFAPSNIERDATAALKTTADCSTTEKGVWVVGAARSAFGGLLTDAEQDACSVVEAIHSLLRETLER
jgi:thioredoxin reductase (NADPH)